MPPELIFILVLIVFSILENALKGKKKKKGGSVERPPQAPLPPGWPPPDNTRTESRGTTRGEQAKKTTPAKRDRAADMVPEELWEEIAALARGDVEETLQRRRARARAEAEKVRRQGTGRAGTARSRTTSPAPPPRAEPQPYEPEEEPRETAVRIGGSGTGIEDRPTPTRSRTPRSREPRSREGFHAEALSQGSRAPDASGTGGRGASSDEKRAQRPATARREVFLRDQAKGPAQSQVRRVRSVFSGGGALRAVVVAREVLGRPLALREYGDEEMWSG